MPFKNVRPEDLFECQQCGDCCKGYGGTFVTLADIEKIADFIGTPRKRFVEAYCRMSGGRPVLAQKADQYCIFWDGACTIHPVKPRMCRQWPFIESVLLDPSNWEIMANLCPGIRTGFPIKVIMDCVRKKIAETPGDFNSTPPSFNPDNPEKP